MMDNYSLKRGQSIIEVVVALLVVSLIALGLVRISSLSLKNASYANEETEAVALAEKKIAELKAEAVNDDLFWSNIVILDPYAEVADTSKGSCYLIRVVNNKSLLPTDTTPRYSDANMAEATVTVYWGLKAENTQCTTVAQGKLNYDHKIEISTLITK